MKIFSYKNSTEIIVVCKKQNPFFPLRSTEIFQVLHFNISTVTAVTLFFVLHQPYCVKLKQSIGFFSLLSSSQFLISAGNELQSLQRKLCADLQLKLVENLLLRTGAQLLHYCFWHCDRYAITVFF